MEPNKSHFCFVCFRGDVVKLSHIEMVHKRAKNDKEARVASIMVRVPMSTNTVLPQI